MKYLNDVSYKDCVGKVFKSLNSGDFKILKYDDKKNVEVQFVTTGYRKVAEMKEVKTGSIKDLYSPSVYGVGVVGAKYSTRVNGVLTKEYALWQSMLKRCYSDNSKKKHPTYIDCEVSDNFKSYEYFYEWCHKQVGFGNDGFELDKDLLIKGNKVYSENTCVFIPAEVNTLLVKRAASRGKHLIGVCWHNAYKEAKESFVKEQANKWKGKIDDRAYNALMNYQVEIDD